LLLRLGGGGGGKATGVLKVWLWWEGLTTWWWRLRPVRPGGILRYQRTRYRGQPRTLADGTELRPGDVILELHFANRVLAQTDSRNPWQVLRALAEDLNLLAQQSAEGELGEVKALHGVTLFARPGQRLGFEFRPLPDTWYTRLMRFFFVGLLLVYHPRGWSGLTRPPDTLWPGEVWLGKNTLARYRNCFKSKSAS